MTKNQLLAIFECDVQFTDEGKLISIRLWLVGIILQAIAPLVPAVAQHDGDEIRTSVQLFGDVVSLVLDPLVIGIQVWRQMFVPDFLPV